MKTLIRVGLTTTFGLLMTAPVLATPSGDQAESKTKAKKKGKIRITLADGTVRNTQKKGVHLAASSKRSRPVQSVERRANEVLFSVRNQDITEVLPLFERQVGVKITYRGPVGKKVTLRLTRPVHWEQALDLIQAFTGTHLTRDYQGRMQLRSGYGGDLRRVQEEAAEERLLRRGKKQASVQASARRSRNRRRARGKIPQNLPKLWTKPKRVVPKIQIGNPRPRRMGAANTRSGFRPPRVGPRRVGPRRTGPSRVGPRRVGPNRVGPRRPMPSF